MKKPKALYIGHPYHQKTQSTQFMIDILSKKYDLNILSYNSGTKDLKDIPEVFEEKYEVLFFFQNLPKAKYLKQLQNKKIIWFPMYDAEVLNGWYKYINLLSRLKIISFSKNFHNHMIRLGHLSFYYQYYPQPKKCNKQNILPKVFFWARRENINWDVVNKLLGENKIGSVIFKNSPDPGNKIILPDARDIAKYNIKVINKWLSKEEYESLLSSCDIYIAPRMYEGIGMSFLEAMAKRKCVIATNSPTMNEYIKHGYNGLLYDIKYPQQVDISKINEITKNLNIEMESKFHEWNTKKMNILDDIDKELPYYSFFYKLKLYIKFFPSEIINLSKIINLKISKFFGEMKNS